MCILVLVFSICVPGTRTIRTRGMKYYNINIIILNIIIFIIFEYSRLVLVQWHQHQHCCSLPYVPMCILILYSASTSRLMTWCYSVWCGVFGVSLVQCVVCVWCLQLLAPQPTAHRPQIYSQITLTRTGISYRTLIHYIILNGGVLLVRVLYSYLIPHTAPVSHSIHTY